MFLKLRQPIESTDYPTPRVLEAGRSYEFPFTFVVPDRLLPQVCTHDRKHEQVHQAHTMLPPTLGDVMILEDGKTYVDDMAPDMSHIGYRVAVSVNRRSETNQRSLKTLVSHAKKVRIIPTTEEAPPIDTEGHANYCLRKEKMVKRGFLRYSLGKLIASASQPKAIRLAAPNCETRDHVSTVVKIQLRFEPMGDEKPPRLGSVYSKIKANTFFNANPWTDFPRQSADHVGFSTIGEGLFSESVPLSNMCVSSAQWECHSTYSDEDRRGSVSTLASDVSVGPSDSFTGDVYYTASIVVPVTLPNNKKFIPTFHSCLMSRVYSIELSLSWHTPSTNVITPSLTLRLPVQIMTESKSADAFKSTVGVVVSQQELDSFFQPRSTTGADQPIVSVTAPPEYSPSITHPRMQAQREPEVLPIGAYNTMHMLR